MTADDLKNLRADYGLTQARLGALAMVSARTVQNWESGAYPMPAYREKLLRSGLKRLGKLSKERK